MQPLLLALHRLVAGVKCLPLKIDRKKITRVLGEAYSTLIFKFNLRREAGYYILEYFLPSIFLVVMSWVSFWIQADAAPARTVLGK